ncbi:MAG TPA: RNA polymerase factor sigma-54 [Ktedonobacteraceae bacterium]|nr:RNA polymerase factor sigma-54 [Ktedonobacteraceae bacterium]
MRLEPTPRPDQTLRVSARLITSSTILHLSSDELERAVEQEQMENPALEVSEKRVCLFCGSALQGPVCVSCGHFEQPTHPSFSAGETQQDEQPVEQQWSEYHSYDIYDYRFSESEDEDELDPMAHIAVDQTLADTLLQQLETLITPEDGPIAEQLVGNLNERGYLEISVQEIAEYLHVPDERVAYVLRQLQTLEPLGIGARDLRECLLIQLEALNEQETIHPLAYALIDGYLDRLGKSQFQEIARALKAPEVEVRQAAQYIRGNLNPFPAHTYQPGADSGAAAAYTRPDIIIRRGEAGFEVELIEEKRYGFHISSGYGTQPLRLENDPGYQEIQRYMRHQGDRAKFFIDCMQRRWRTLKQVAELIVDYQHEFLEKGIRYLRPFTRSEVATRLNLDEGTISRATANKYALLPTGHLIPLADFFDGSLGVKDVLREVISTENPRHHLSDDELARLMTARGIPMARRTVTKYREEMGIGSSRERG